MSEKILMPAAACFACGNLTCDWDCKETWKKRAIETHTSLTAAQAEIARLKEDIKESNRLFMLAKDQRNVAEDKVKQLQSALDVAVEGLGFFATEGFYRMTDFITTSPVAEVGKMPENIKVYGNPVLTLGLKKATEALDKIKKIKGE